MYRNDRAVRQWLSGALAALLVQGAVGLWTVGDSSRPVVRAGSNGVETYPGDAALGPTTATSTTPPPLPGTAPADSPVVIPRRADLGPPVPNTVRYSGPVTVLQGRVIDGDNKPVPNLRVSLTEHRDDLDTTTTPPLGRFCSRSPSHVDCAGAGTATTGPDGRYAIKVLEELGHLQALRDFDLRVPLTGELAATVMRVEGVFDPKPVNLLAPDLVAWRPGFSVKGSHALWQKVSTRQVEDPPAYTLAFTRRTTEGALREFYRVWGEENGAQFEPRILEDETVRATVSVTDGDMRWLSHGIEVRGTYIPPSRNKPCRAKADSSTGAGELYFDVCPVTDNDDSTRIEGPYHTVVIDLGEPTELRLATIRGYTEYFEVQASNDADTNVWMGWVSNGERDEWAGSRTAGNSETRPDSTEWIIATESTTARYVRFGLKLESPPLYHVDRFSLWASRASYGIE